jgi:hypothetical protein
VAELGFDQPLVGFYHASVPDSTKLDTTLAFTICARGHSFALNGHGPDLSQSLDFVCAGVGLCFSVALNSTALVNAGITYGRPAHGPRTHARTADGWCRETVSPAFFLGRHIYPWNDFAASAFRGTKGCCGSCSIE